MAEECYFSFFFCQVVSADRKSVTARVRTMVGFYPYFSRNKLLLENVSLKEKTNRDTNTCKHTRHYKAEHHVTQSFDEVEQGGPFQYNEDLHISRHCI